jgi:hypothetical protein
MFRKLGVLGVCAAIVACSGDPNQVILSCNAAQPPTVALGVGNYVSLDQTCATFPANASTTDSAEYLVVAQSAGGKPGAAAGYELRASSLLTASVVGPPMSAARTARPGGALAAQFDHYLRDLARSPAVVPPGERLDARAAVSAVQQVVTPPVVGGYRVFKHVCANLGCTTWDTVTAVVKAMSGHVAIYVDTLRPGDLSQADLDSLAQIFDQHVYAIDTATFGHEPDIDNNGVVIALLSGIINSLSPSATCFTSGYVAGFFFSPDLDIQVSSLYDNGEIMYGLVADTSTPPRYNSCNHPIASVKRLLPPTFLHELEHMISYTQHVRVRRPAPAEDIWLDEALANYAEELGARSYLAEGDTNAFNRYVLDNLNDAYEYLEAPQDHYLIAPDDQNLPSNGAGWLFVRYLMDQIGDTLARKLVNTALTGTSNISTQSAVPFETLVQGWALANWASDLPLPGFTPRPELRYKSWQFRQAFAALKARDTTGRYPVPFPFVPLVMAGAQVSVAGTLRAGSGQYVRVMQAPSAPTFTLVFTGPGSVPLPTTINPRLVVLRLR